MASAIDATKPTAVAALTADVRGNFSAAKTEIEALQTGKQDALVSGTSIKTVNSTSLLGSGNISISAAPGGSSTHVQSNDGGSLYGDSGFTYDKITQSTTHAGGTRTASGSTVTITETRNNAGVTFPGALVVNTTETASAAGSKVFDVQVGGVSQVSVNKLGTLRVISTASTTDPSIKSSGRLLLGSSGGGESICLVNDVAGLHAIFGPTFGLQLSIGGKFSVGGSPANGNNADVAWQRGAAGRWDATDGQGVPSFRDVKVRNLILTGNLARGIVAKTANYTVTANDGVIQCDATSGAITLTLPAVAGVTPGTTYTLKKIDASANAVIWDGNAAETIDGATTVQTTTQWGSITIICNATSTAWLTLKD